MFFWFLLDIEKLAEKRDYRKLIAFLRTDDGDETSGKYGKLNAATRALIEMAGDTPIGWASVAPGGGDNDSVKSRLALVCAGQGDLDALRKFTSFRVNEGMCQKVLCALDGKRLPAISLWAALAKAPLFDRYFLLRMLRVIVDRHWKPDDADAYAPLLAFFYALDGKEERLLLNFFEEIDPGIVLGVAEGVEGEHGLAKIVSKLLSLIADGPETARKPCAGYLARLHGACEGRRDAETLESALMKIMIGKEPQSRAGVFEAAAARQVMGIALRQAGGDGLAAVVSTLVRLFSENGGPRGADEGAVRLLADLLKESADAGVGASVLTALADVVVHGSEERLARFLECPDSRVFMDALYREWGEEAFEPIARRLAAALESGGDDRLAGLCARHLGMLGESVADPAKNRALSRRLVDIVVNGTVRARNEVLTALSPGRLLEACERGADGGAFARVIDRLAESLGEASPMPVVRACVGHMLHMHKNRKDGDMARALGRYNGMEYDVDRRHTDRHYDVGHTDHEECNGQIGVCYDHEDTLAHSDHSDFWTRAKGRLELR